MDKAELKRALKKIWWFIWESDSVWSWIVNIILAFIIIKFLVYPGLGFLLQTTHPIVAVVSGSMEHKYLGIGLSPCGTSNERWVSLDQYWDECGLWYIKNTNITKEDFIKFDYKNGFNKGDIMVLKGKNPEDIQIGDIVVFNGRRKDPIIHRIVTKTQEDNTYYFQTKGDHNKGQDPSTISQEEIVGYKKYQKCSKAVLRIPLLGYIKIGFVKIINLFRW